MRRPIVLVPLVMLATGSCTSSDDDDESEAPVVALTPLAAEARSVTSRDGTVVAFELVPAAAVAPHAVFARYGAELGLGADDQIELGATRPGVNGLVHYVGHQTFRGVPIAGAAYSLTVKDGVVVSGLGRIVNGLALDPTPIVAEDVARAAAFAAFGAREPRPIAPGTLVIAASGTRPAADAYRLVWRFAVETEVPYDVMRVDIDAHTADLLPTRSMLLGGNTPAVGETMEGNTVTFTAWFDPAVSDVKLRQEGARAIWTGDHTGVPPYIPWQVKPFTDPDGTFDDGEQRPGVSAYYAAEELWDLLASVAALHPGLSAQGLDGNGSQITLMTGAYFLDADTVDRAAWDALHHVALFATGSPAAPAALSPELVGHELAHGLISYAMGDILPEGEAEAYVEGLADAFGVALASEIAGAPVWTVGAGVFDAASVRNLADPNANGFPDTYGGQYWVDFGAPHHNATIVGRWFHLLAMGNAAPQVNDLGYTYQINGIGLDEATFVILHALRTGKVDSAGDHVSLRMATLESAAEVYGATSATYNTVAKAWSAVGVGDSQMYSPPNGTVDVDPWPVPLGWQVKPDPEVYLRAGFCDRRDMNDRNSPCYRGAGSKWEVKWDVQVSTSPTFDEHEDPLLEYTTDQVSCVAHIDPIPWDTDPGYFMSGMMCGSSLPDGLNLFPLTQYYWRHRPWNWDQINPPVAGTWSATHVLTTGEKQTTNLSPASSAKHVFPWPVVFDWTPVSGAQSYKLHVDKACAMSPSADIVGPGMTMSPTDIMELIVDAPPGAMDLDILADHCFTVIPVGPPIGPKENLGTPSYKAGNALEGQYDTFMTSGAEPLFDYPHHATLDVPPWKNLFEWQPVQNAAYYETEFAPWGDYGFAQLWQCGDLQTSSCKNEILHTLTLYLWRVRARGPIDGRTGEPRVGDWADQHQSPPMNPLSDTLPWGDAVWFKTSDAKVVLLDPPDKSDDALLWPTTVTWEDNGADSYDIHVHTSESFEDGAGNVLPAVQFLSFWGCTDKVGGKCTAKFALEPDTTYYWRVMGHGPNDDDGAWSDTWEFTTASLQPECVHPCNGEVVYPWPTPLQFTRVPNAESYTLEVDDIYTTDAPYRRTIELDPAAGGNDPDVYTAEVNLGPRIGVDYTWRVRAELSNGTTGEWSNEPNLPQHFTFDDASTPILCDGSPPFCPPDNVVDVFPNIPVPLSWSTPPGAIEYTLQACPSDSYDPVVDSCAGSQYTVTADTVQEAVGAFWTNIELPKPEETWMWRVRAAGPFDLDDTHSPKNGMWTSWRSFKTAKEPEEPEDGHQCGDSMAAGDINGADYWVDLGQTQGSFPVTAQFYEVPDRLRIYDDTGEIFDSGCVSYGNTNPYIDFQSASGEVHVVVDGDCEGTGSTEWWVAISCPWDPR
jgi:Zn-dependent metalloprotease